MDVYFSKELLKSRAGLISMFVLLVMVVIDLPVLDIPIIRAKPAEARIGRPVTPVSVGGVRRRTRRRTAVAVSASSARRVSTKPAGCVSTIVGGVKYENCDGVYYRPYYQGDQVVYEEVDKP